jgi:glycerol uptake facilitator-like aquaporin
MTMRRRLLAEGIGSSLLAATVIGSGIMAQRLSSGNAAIALLANTGATVAVLAVLIRLFAPISGHTSIRRFLWFSLCAVR